jgi:hypothetical protein
MAPASRRCVKVETDVPKFHRAGPEFTGTGRRPRGENG